MKKLTKVLAVMMALALSAFVFAACGSKSDSKKDSKADGGNTSAVSQTADDQSGAQASAADVDYDNPTATFGEGDYEAMKTYASEMQSNGHQGEVVKVTGTSARSMFGAKATVSISDGGSQKIGTTYKIDGVDTIDDYPAEDAEVEITGVVTLEEGGIGCYIAVPADKVVVK